MGRPIRHVDRDTLQFITIRCAESRYWLRPDKEANKTIGGLIGRTLHLYPEVKLYAFVAMSNHLHLIASGPPKDLADSLAYLHGNMARRINRHRMRSGPFWHRRCSIAPILDDGAEVERLIYLLCNPVQAALVARAAQWPGFSTLHENTGGNPRVVHWFDIDGFNTAVRNGERPDRKDYEIPYLLKLQPLPGLADLSPRERADFVRSRVRQRESEVAEELAFQGKRPAGVHAVLRQAPDNRPARTKRTPRPLCHSSSVEAWQAYAEEYRAYFKAYKACSKLFRLGAFTTPFPENSHRPTAPPQPP
jgi:REP element-mobilizing transposase RayT